MTNLKNIFHHFLSWWKTEGVSKQWEYWWELKPNRSSNPTHFGQSGDITCPSPSCLAALCPVFTAALQWQLIFSAAAYAWGHVYDILGSQEKAEWCLPSFNLWKWTLRGGGQGCRGLSMSRVPFFFFNKGEGDWLEKTTLTHWHSAWNAAVM